MNISAIIRGIQYKPLLCRKLNTFPFEELAKALSKDGTFILKAGEQAEIALSWWVSAKRTRSYPYARVYDSLGFVGKKATIIPFMKDEGKDGDRDFLQWDTISLMSLLGVHVIVGYYSEAQRSNRYTDKVTKQRFNLEHLSDELRTLLSYQSDALHWNLLQIDKVNSVSQKALDAYVRMSAKLNVPMHSFESAARKIAALQEGKDEFMNTSRALAERAQQREVVTLQPKESVSGNKAGVTIRNFLGGQYYLTCDAYEVKGNQIHLIESKHTKKSALPTTSDIKDALLKMMLYVNLSDVRVESQNYTTVPTVRLTTVRTDWDIRLSKPRKELVSLLREEAKLNNFKLLIEIVP